jgi:nucleoid-associated protein YgaU
MGNRMTEPYEPYQPEQEYDWDYEDEPRAQMPKILWGRVVALGAVLLLAFFLGRATAPEGIPEERLTQLQSDNADLRAENQDLQDELDQRPATTQLPTPTPSDTQSPTGNVDTQIYTVKSGDTLVGIAQRLYGDPSFADCIADENGMGSDTTLRTGDQLVIPPENEC